MSCLLDRKYEITERKHQSGLEACMLSFHHKHSILLLRVKHIYHCTSCQKTRPCLVSQQDRKSLMHSHSLVYQTNGK